MWTDGCVTVCDVVSGNNGKNPNEGGKIFFDQGSTLNTHTAIAVVEWARGLLPVVRFYALLSLWNACKNEVTNLYSFIIRKLRHFLTNRCIREPYVQWCEGLSLSVNCRQGSPLDYALAISFILVASQLRLIFGYHLYLCYQNQVSIEIQGNCLLYF